MTADRATVLRRLSEQRIPAADIAVGPQARIVVSEYGSRVYGPFFRDGIAENWIPAVFQDGSAFAELIASGHWNIGGDRTWIGPEIAYMIPNRADYWGTYTMPPDLDPGTDNVLARHDDGVIVSRTVRLRSFTAPGTLAATFSVTVGAAPDPLRHLRDKDWDPAVVDYGGYTVTTSLAPGSESTAELDVESWTLNQVRAGGVAVVPTTGAGQVTDYYEPVGRLLRRRASAMDVILTGADRFKVGFAAPTTFGRLGYLRREVEGASVLVVRSSPNDASADYAEEPDFAVGTRGDSLHLYNDDGGLGGFAELEARGTPIRSGTRPTHADDRFSTWWFRGETGAVEAIGTALLGDIGPASSWLSSRRYEED